MLASLAKVHMKEKLMFIVWCKDAIDWLINAHFLKGKITQESQYPSKLQSKAMTRYALLVSQFLKEIKASVWRLLPNKMFKLVNLVAKFSCLYPFKLLKSLLLFIKLLHSLTGLNNLILLSIFLELFLLPCLNQKILLLPPF